MRAVARVGTSVPIDGRVFGVGVVLLDPRPGLGLLGILDVVDTVDVAGGHDRFGREHDLVALLDVDHDLLALLVVVALDPDRDGRHDVEECIAIVEGGLVEDRESFATLVVDDLGPHTVVGRNLLLAGRQFHLLEQLVALDLLAELEADLGQSLLDVELVGMDAVDLGRQNLAVDQFALSGGFLFGNHVRSIAGTALCVHGAEQMKHGIVLGGIAGTESHEKDLSMLGKESR